MTTLTENRSASGLRYPRDASTSGSRARTLPRMICAWLPTTASRARYTIGGSTAASRRRPSLATSKQRARKPA